MKRHFPLHTHITILFLLLILLVGGLIGGVGYTLSRNAIESEASVLTERISREAISQIRSLLAPVEMATNLLRYSALAEAASLKDRLNGLGLLREALSESTALSSIYVGYESGDFFFLRRVGDEAEGQRLKAPAATRYILQTIERAGKPAVGRYAYLDADLHTLLAEDRPDYPGEYDPRTRDWYQAAMAAKSQIKVPPYLFFSDKKVGTTIATRAQNGRAVIGADIRLETLNQDLARYRVTPGMHAIVANAQGLVIAHEDAAKLLAVSAAPDGRPGLMRIEDLGVPVLSGLAATIRTLGGKDSYATLLRLADGDWRVSIQPLLLEGTQSLYLVFAIPERELLAAAFKQLSIAALVTIAIMLLAIPMTWFMAHGISRGLRLLVEEAEAIRHFDFSTPTRTESRVTEVNELGETLEGMKRAIRRFIDISQAVAAEENFDLLLPMLLTEMLSAADADAGVLYLANEERLVPMSALASAGKDLMGMALPVAQVDAATLLGAAIGKSQPQSGTMSAGELGVLGLGSLSGTGAFRQAVAVPLLNRRNHLVGAMLLVLPAPIAEAQVSFIKALSGSATSSLETRELIKAQKVLFEAFIQLIAGAIDAKSPYTGGHCARVPELTKMLVRATCAQTSGLYKDFALDEHEWEAVHVAAWLHDCGKVTTPEYVVDKATKLETINDRIHEVRTRFEVLKRDAQIACLEAVAAGAEAAPMRQRLADELGRLDDDFAFVAACNEGGEYMAPEKLERLGRIAARTWVRTLDDRVGISHEEKERKERVPTATLPAVESLLADKPEHIFERRPQDRIAADNQWGFRMTVPEFLYNKGELYNLSVRRGTLSAEERYKINEHMVQTLMMLSQLPFPRHLRQVPEIAGGHHEKMDGTGYPKRIGKDQMSPVARMMAIADIFEALTAVDRPYKKGKTLTESLQIMSKMKKEHHIDPDLFDLFLRSGVYLEYAQRFLHPGQIDTVDIEKYIADPVAA